jgi:hypothetical protein
MPHEAVAFVHEQDAATHPAHVESGRQTCGAAADDDAVDLSRQGLARVSFHWSGL